MITAVNTLFNGCVVNNTLICIKSVDKHKILGYNYIKTLRRISGMDEESY